VSKYDQAGNLLWTRQFGTGTEEEGRGVSADHLGNVYISGHTLGSLGGANAGKYDAFLRKYDADGNLIWTRQLGTSVTEQCFGASADGLGNVYISGVMENIHGVDDAFVAKYDSAGNLLWNRQFGASGGAVNDGVSADGLGGVYISGWTFDTVGDANLGFRTAFVSKYDASGTRLWTNELGTNNWDESSGVSADGYGNIYISGYTRGNLGGISNGRNDAFVAKFSEIPEPSSAAIGLAAMTMLWPVVRRGANNFRLLEKRLGATTHVRELGSKKYP
jgi:hypothetical protein